MTIELVERIAAQKVALENAIAATPDERDLRTPREQEAAVIQRNTLWQRWRSLTNGEDDVADLEPKVAAVEKWVRVLTDSRSKFCERLLAIAEPGRSGEAQTLRLAISNTDRGCETFGEMTMLAQPLADALYAAGYTPLPGDRTVWGAGFGPLPTAQRQLETLKKRLATAQAAIDRELATTV